MRRGKPQRGWDMTHASSVRLWPVRHPRPDHILRSLPKSLTPANPELQNRSNYRRGETTVTIRGKGKGGRNQEMALAYAIELHRIPPLALQTSSFCPRALTQRRTHGCGRSLCYADLMEKMKAISAQAAAHLKENDAYNFFSNMGIFSRRVRPTQMCAIFRSLL